ncbi:hypothetical protein [Brevibacillus borstelensis]|uniref:TlpA family protein disulfide reductase n=1 Tax=Brevibacillus borstelensis TaxID=45462 RepID=UPI0030C0EE5B
MLNQAYLISHILLWAIVLIQMVVMYAIVRLVVQFLNRFRLSDKKIELSQLQAGQGAPSFREKDQQGNVIQPIAENGGDTLLMFVGDSCGTCKEILPYLAELRKQYPHIRMIAVAEKIYYEQSIELPPGIPLLRSSSLFGTYLISKVPTLVLIDHQGIIQAVEQISALQQLVNLLEHQSKKAS